MKQEDKQLLLKDLCARQPYGVKIQGVNPDGEVIVEELSTIGIDGDGIFDCNMIELSDIKPYLFPMKNMTEEQTLSIRDYLQSIEGRLLGSRGPLDLLFGLSEQASHRPSWPDRKIARFRRNKLRNI